MTPFDQVAVAPYVALVGRLLSEELKPVEFERRFFDAWGGDPNRLSKPTFQVMERFFFVVEDYVDDPSLRGAPEDLDEEQLREGARRFLAELAALPTE